MSISVPLSQALGIALGNNQLGSELATILNGSQAGASTFTGGLTVTTADLTLTDVDVVGSTATGTKLPKLATQKLGFFGATPIVQPANTVDYVTSLVNLGLRATGGTATATFPGTLSAVGITSTGSLTISAQNIVTDTSTGTKIGTGATQKLGFFGATPVVQGTAYTQTYATADKTIANLTASSVVTTAAGLASYGFTEAQANALVAAVNALLVDVTDVKQALNSVIDDLQALGLVA